MFGQSYILPKNKEINLDEKASEHLTSESEVIVNRDLEETPTRSDTQISNIPQKIKKNATKDGEKDAIKNIAREREINNNKMDEAIDRAQTILFRCRSVFPFDLFPNDLIIDLSKVTVVYRSFFMSGRLQSVYMRDIVDVEIDTGPLFSSLAIVDMFYAQNKLEIKHLKKKDAVRAREIIIGVVAAIKQNVDVTRLDSNDLLDRIRELTIASRSPTP